MQQHGALPFCQPCKQDAAVSGHPTGGRPSQPGNPPQVPSWLPCMCIFALTAENKNRGECPAQQAHVARAMVAHWRVCTHAEECCFHHTHLLRDVHSMPALERSTSLAPNTRRSGTAVCQAMPIAEVAGEFAEISGFATVMFAITLVVSTNRRAIHRANCLPSWRHSACLVLSLVPCRQHTTSPGLFCCRVWPQASCSCGLRRSWRRASWMMCSSEQVNDIRSPTVRQLQRRARISRGRLRLSCDGCSAQR